MKKSFKVKTVLLEMTSNGFKVQFVYHTSHMNNPRGWNVDKPSPEKEIFNLSNDNPVIIIDTDTAGDWIGEEQFLSDA